MDNNPTAPNDTSEWSPEPFESRKSQNVGHTDFLKAGVLHLVLGAAGGTLAGHVVARLMRLPGEAAAITKTCGAFVGAFAGSFRIWRKQENAALNVHETLQRYKELEDISPTNAYLADDNQVLKLIAARQREQLEGQPKPRIHAASSEHSMMLAEHAQSQAIH